ncbi:GTP-binding protein 10 isoform X2 [Nematostella vectensis]|nr:GTP-binding protein 10 isoform X2 [Nematostella vectensis]XP_032218258.2 GTP-binding protein 10 isoform X2 [Nematostella vectensis]XP_048578256.1 GTP-binding protein 10 isoform X2 [Nematostella vectensis]
MPFRITSGGKYVIHLLQKYQPEKALVLVRSKALVRELKAELEENGFCCIEYRSADTPYSSEIESTHGSISPVALATDEDAGTWRVFPQVDLLILVQQPQTGLNVMRKALSSSNFIRSDGKAVFMYTQNDYPFINKLQKNNFVVNQLTPPSFYQDNTMLRATQFCSELTRTEQDGEASSLALHHRSPEPELQAPLPAKTPQYAVFHPPVPVSSHISERGRLCDHARLYVRGGSGGQGSMAHAGMGGDGGDVILECRDGASLQPFTLRENRRFTAGRGTHYSSLKRRKRGIRGLDLVVPVPPGTTVTTDDGRFIGKLEELGTRLLVARGGRGGNPSTEDWGGEKGNACIIRIDLKLAADVGLVGFPNAGKSTLLGMLTQADPTVADYPFTTLRPVIGMLGQHDDSQISVADLPGLVEGAHLNRGMGHKFLKHVEGTRLLALVVDVNGFQLSSAHPRRTAFESLCLLLKELVLYESRLTYQPKLLIVSKMDCERADSKYQELLEQLQTLRNPGGLLVALGQISADSPASQEPGLRDLLDMRSVEFDDVIPISALSGEGMERMRERINEMVPGSQGRS